MKQRYRLNNDANVLQAMVWEDHNQIIVKIYETEALIRGFYEPKEVYVFNTILQYEEWKTKQRWLDQKKEIKYGAFQKVPHCELQKDQLATSPEKHSMNSIKKHSLKSEDIMR